jgi:transposase
VPAPLSLDLRTRIVHACQSGELTQPEIADLFQVHLKTVEKYWHLARTGQPLAPKPFNGGPRPKLGGYTAVLRALVAEMADATLVQLSQVLADRHRVQVSVSVLSRTLAHLGLPQKKRRF